jgi:hypothetical protein
VFDPGGTHNCTVALIPFAASRCIVSSYSSIMRIERQCEELRKSGFLYAFTVGVGASAYVVASRCGTQPFGAFASSGSSLTSSFTSPPGDMGLVRLVSRGGERHFLSSGFSPKPVTG